MNKKITVSFLSLMLIFQSAGAFASNFPAYKVFIKASMALKEGKIEEAQKNYEKVISLDPSAIAAYKELVLLYWQKGNKNEALKAAEKINDLGGNNAKNTIFLGNFYLLANQPETARSFWEKTLEIEPDNEMATVYLASYYYSDNKYKESIDYWNKFLEQQPDSSAGYFQLAIVQEKFEMHEEALESYNKVVELKPEAKEAYLSKGRIYEKMKKYDLAIKEYERYIEVFPDNFYVLMYLGKCYFEAGDNKKAKSIFLKAKRGLKDDLTPSYWLAEIHEREMAFNKAATEYEYIYTKEQSVNVLAKLGYYYSLLKEYKKAEQKLQAALKKEPYNYEILYLTALNYMDWEKYGKAVEYLIKTLEISPDFVDGHFFLGSAYHKLEDFDKAEASFKKTIELDPKHTRAMNYLGYTYADKNIKLEDAEKLLEKAVMLEPNNGAFIDSLGWLYYRQGKYEEAKILITEAAKMTSDPVVYDHLGDICIETENLEDAWFAYAFAYDLKKDKDIKKKLDLVQGKLSKSALYERTLKRTNMNYLKLPSFKTGYKANFSSGVVSKRTYIPLEYTKNKDISIEIPSTLIMGGAYIYISDGQVSSEPKAVLQSLIPEIQDLIKFASEIFNKDFLNSFIDAEIKEKGKDFIYFNNKNNIKLIIDSETAMIKEISKKDIKITPSKYERAFHSNLPTQIKVKAKEAKFKAIFKSTSITLKKTEEEKKNNDDKAESTGKN